MHGAAAASADISGRRNRLLHSTILVQLGKAFFALYLVHVMVLEWIQRSVSDQLPNAVIATLGIVAALILAEVAHRLIETPCERSIRARIGVRPDRVTEAGH